MASQLERRDAQIPNLQLSANNKKKDDQKALCSHNICEIIISPVAVRILNANILFFVIVAILIRLGSFGGTTKKEQTTNADGQSVETVVEVGVTFSFIFSTLFVLPFLTIAFICAEFRVMKGKLIQYFLFLNDPICKGIYLIMLALMLLEIQNTATVIFVLVIISGALFDIAIGCVRISRQQYDIAAAAAIAKQQEMQGTVIVATTDDLEMVQEPRRGHQLNSGRIDENQQLQMTPGLKGKRKLNSSKKSQGVSYDVVNMDEITIEDAGQRTMNLPSNSGAPVVMAENTPDFHQTEVKKQRPAMKGRSRHSTNSKSSHPQTFSVEMQGAGAHIEGAQNRHVSHAAAPSRKSRETSPELQSQMAPPTTDPSQLTRQLSLNSTMVDKELTDAAYALYRQLKRCLRNRDFQEFDTIVTQARKIAKTGKIGMTKFCLVNKVADLREKDGKNLLHLTAAIAANDDDTRYFIRLLDMHFPLYDMDNELAFPAFYTVNVKSDSKFSSTYNALCMQGFDLNYPNSDGQTFLEHMIMNGTLNANRIKSILQTQPTLDQTHLDSLQSKLALCWAKQNNAEVKSVMAYVKKYVDNRKAKAKK